MSERNYYGSDGGGRQDNLFTDSPRRYRSEAQASRQGRLSRLFGVPEQIQPPPAGASAGAQEPGGVVIYSPSTYEDVQLLIDHLKRREQVIVDFSDINQTSVYRILDFMSGAIYALNGSIQQIAKNIFLFAPSGVTITVPPHLGRR